MASRRLCHSGGQERVFFARISTGLVSRRVFAARDHSFLAITGLADEFGEIGIGFAGWIHRSFSVLARQGAGTATPCSYTGNGIGDATWRLEAEGFGVVGADHY